ncbi:HAD family hydrolase [Mastigocladopsis repens]|uniref:HAD family hydrolase n=1 Tax=Mastigocladopsis repens TaxID=221287 RepID=UPI0003079B0E|nr:HAD hydrolase-like protein [Mastigocladopsis repens]
MTANSPTILALDFDGVICDGLIEYFEVAWRTYCQVWLPEQETPSIDLASKFYRLRPVIETGWEMPVLVKALVEEIAEERILQEWAKIAQELLLRDNVKATEIGSKLDKIRDEWIATDLDGWLSLHKFFQGVKEKLKATATSTVKLYIITTKEGRFAQQLLKQGGVEIPREVIFGKEVKRSKHEILRELIQGTNTLPDSVWFVEDRLKTLQLVQQQPDLNEVKLFLADWGYNTPTEKVTAQNDPRIQVLSLTKFAQDFSEWEY